MRGAVKQYFFLHYPHTVKVQVRDGKTGKVRETSRNGVVNVDRREEFKERFGEERFEKLMKSDSYYRKFRDPEIPPGCKWMFSQFLYVWGNAPRDGMTGNVLFTFSTINEYVECMKAPLSLAEKKLMLRMSHWAKETIAEFDAPPPEKKSSGSNEAGRRNAR